VIDVFHPERNFGFILSANFSSDRIFFHVSEVEDGKSVKVGDRVEFSLSFSQKAKKNCAVNLKILSHGYLSPRKTERVRVKENDDLNARVSVLRQPLGPDGTKGFNLKRTLENCV
jgi:cold shock CspA family protein